MSCQIEAWRWSRPSSRAWRVSRLSLGRAGGNMDLRLLATVFGTVFLAELGDKTQLATLLFASRAGTSLIAVFVAASLALVAATAIGVLAGATISSHVQPKYFSYVAGVGFILIGVWNIWRVDDRVDESPSRFLNGEERVPVEVDFASDSAAVRGLVAGGTA